jgi:hypothetical protein
VEPITNVPEVTNRYVRLPDGFDNWNDQHGKPINLSGKELLNCIRSWRKNHPKALEWLHKTYRKLTVDIWEVDVRKLRFNYDKIKMEA